MRTETFLMAALSLGLPFVGGAALADEARRSTATSSPSVDRNAVTKILAGWSPGPVLGAQQMLATYGLPQEATSEKLVWHRKGPFKRITVTRVEDPHDFPKPHMDYLQHTVDYRVPSSKSTALLQYDGSVTLDRTVGEMSARCDLEGHNILTLNLAHDIVTGKKTAKQARTAFGKNVVADVLGKYPPYVVALQFDPKSTAGADPDVPVIPGSPKRTKAGDASSSKAMGDAEVLAFIIAVDDNEILAAMEAAKKTKVDPRVLAYASRLHQEHGKNLEQTMKLGAQIRATPIDTPAVDQLRVKGAQELGMLVPIGDAQFGAAYLAAMVKGHTEVLAMIDGKLSKAARNPAVKKHLDVTRGHIAMHLDEARKLQASVKTQASR